MRECILKSGVGGNAFAPLWAIVNICIGCYILLFGFGL